MTHLAEQDTDDVFAWLRPAVIPMSDGAFLLRCNSGRRDTRFCCKKRQSRQGHRRGVLAISAKVQDVVP